MPEIAAPRPIVSRSTAPRPIAGRRRRLTAAVATLALAAGSAVVVATPATAAVPGFSAGDVVVYRVGTGSAALANTGTPVFLDEFTPGGTAGQSVALPTTTSGANKPLVASGTAGSEGLLTLSGDGRYLVATGYSAAVGASGLTGAAKTTPRTVARVDASDAIDTSTALSDAADGNNVRSAASQDGTGFWVAGGAGGVRYAQLGATTSTQLTATAVNLRQVAVTNGQLYASGDPTKAGGTTVATVGTGLPTTGTQPVTNLITAAKSPSPYAYSLLTLGSGTAPDTLYVADSTNNNVTKYSLVGGTWTATGSVNLGGVTGVTANDVKGVVTVYVTTPTGLYKFSDSSGAGGTLSGSPTQIATAPANTAFRGVAFAPGTTIGSGGAPPANPAPTITAANAGLPAALGDSTVPSTTLTVADSAYPAAQLTVAATSSNQSVAKDSGITITGTDATRTLSVAPAGTSGKATITLTVTAPDGQTGTTSITYGVSPDIGNSTARYYSGAGNASAAIDVGNGYAVVGDDENNVLRLYNLGRSGPPVKTFDFSALLPSGTTEIDIEAAARRGNTIYWEGSMSNTSGGNAAPARSTVFATTISGTGADTTLTYVGAYTGLRGDLLAWDHANNDALGLTASAATGIGGHDATGLNLEGMEFAGTGNTLYLSFRAPLEPTTNRHLALLVPLTNVAADIAAGPTATGTSTFGTPVELNLGGLGVRDIKQNADGQYLISAGTADDSNTGFVLYYWDGNPADDPQPTGTTLPQVPSGTPGSWETIVSTPEPLTAGSSVELIQDDGTVTWYGDGLTTKTGMLPDLQKSVGLTFTYAAPAARASTTTLAADSASSTAGANVTYTATVAPAAGNGTPSGTVDFSDGGTDIPTCTKQPVTQGTATCTVSYTAVGSHTVTATYGGDPTYTGSTSGAVTHSVTAAGLDHLVLTPGRTTVTAGASGSFTAEGYDAYGNDLGDETSAATFALAPVKGGGSSTGASCTASACTATAAGSYTVRASVGSASGTAELDVTAGPVASLSLSPAAASVAAGTAETYTVSGADAYGNPTGDATAASTLTITPTSGGSTDGADCSGATCTAQRVGTYTVRSTDTTGTVSGGASGSTTLTITPAAGDHLAVSPMAATVPAGTQQAYTAESYDRFGNDVRSDAGASFAITPDGSGTGAACSAGSCGATTAGSYTVTATDGSLTGSTPLTVTAATTATVSLTPASASTPAGLAVTYAVSGADAYGNPTGDRTGASTLTIAPRTGGSATGASCTGASCTADVVGTYTVTATDGTATGTAVLTVTAGGRARLVVSPATASQPAGSAQQYAVEGYDAYGNDLGDVTATSTFAITASSTDSSAGASCTAAGSCTATTAGTYTVTASNTADDGKPLTGTATLTVAAATTATLVLSPPSSSVTAGGSQAYTVEGHDRYGNDVGPVSATVTISPDGTGTGAGCSGATCTATRVGTYTVTATAGTATGTAQLTVTAGALDHLVLSPATRTVPAGVGQPYTAEGYDSYGNDVGDVTGRTTFTITGAASCSGSTCTATDGGAHTVTGSAGSATGSATLTTTIPPTVTTVSPSRGTTPGGTTVTVSGTGFTGTRQVYFGDTPAARFSVGSDTTLTAVTPAHAAGAVSVRVVADTGSSSGGPTFTYVTPPPTVTGISPRSGSTTGGTVVTVTGTGFVGVQYVYFGTVRVSAFTVLSSTRLTVTAPAQGRVTRHVVVRTPAGYSTTVTADEYTYVTAAPTVGAISPRSGPTTGGTVVTVTGTGFVGVQYVYFGTVRVSAFTVVSGTRLTVVAPAQAAVTRHVVVRTPAGYSTTVFADEYTYRAR